MRAAHPRRKPVATWRWRKAELSFSDAGSGQKIEWLKAMRAVDYAVCACRHAYRMLDTGVPAGSDSRLQRTRSIRVAVWENEAPLWVSRTGMGKLRGLRRIFRLIPAATAYRGVSTRCIEAASGTCKVAIPPVRSALVPSEYADCRNRKLRTGHAPKAQKARRVRHAQRSGTGNPAHR